MHPRRTGVSRRRWWPRPSPPAFPCVLA